ncbi:MAG: hypothetical protein LBH93_03270 [Chitinispirillales bacterium]|jgi:hypothetical protein|nr:hypothetical protein [Chitinispirillales bacterium]
MDILMSEEKPNAGGGIGAAKPFLGIHFKCCGVYCRIYRNRKQDAYEGMCPKCHKRVKLPIGSGGTDNRFFEVT